jgi:hypothetical protein
MITPPIHRLAIRTIALRLASGVLRGLAPMIFNSFIQNVEVTGLALVGILDQMENYLALSFSIGEFFI